ncbi:EAL domain-containing protein [Pseudomonas sp. RL]|uniref:putative bifunctional diguanylate cyclase/phosphodiesterase n=1 Tax=Pseudomonas sp. RL TaxID=1452718 RepID=UPI000486F114|nr:EAL domain-containing protein [Pseudomonas sp. RL]
MSPEQELKPLFQRIGLDRAEIHTRIRYLDWTPADGARLNQHAEALRGFHDDFVDSLYVYLQGFEPLSRLLRDENTLRRLKGSQREYYRSLFAGPYDYRYVHERLRVGMVHERIGLEMKWYLGAYRLYLDRLLAELFADSEHLPLFASLLKAVFFDISMAVDAYAATQRQALEDSEARFARAMRGANDGLWDWDVEYDRLYVSERWASMLGLTRDTLTDSSQSWFNRVHPDDLPALRQTIDTHLRGETATLQHEYRIRRGDGGYAWVLVRGIAERDRNGGLRLTGSQTDISERKLAEQRLRHAARHDPLTGLANRTRLDELLHQLEQRQLHGEQEVAALLFVDLDRFKLINDSLGHSVGDQVLIQIAQRLQRCLRHGDHLARFGGDEFVVLLHNIRTNQDAERVAQAILDTLQDPLQVAGHELMVSASIGIAPLNQPGQVREALQAADLALYRAKSAGKAQYARYSSELQAAAQHRLELENALAQALSRDEFELYYQPIYRIDEGRPQLRGVEALMRWRQNGRPVEPGSFVPVLEESGEIIRVGDWVLREACRQVREWQLAGQPLLSCSVNLSNRQLLQPGFAARVMNVLAETGLVPESLVLEITEGVLMEDSAELHANLRRLARLGIRLALDDFGTGYCSLGYLKRFPLHSLKVDKSFILGAHTDPDLFAISRAIIGLGKALGLTVTAEGVECEEHLEFLQREGCQYAQGFLFSRPVPAAQLACLFETQPDRRHAPVN